MSAGELRGLAGAGRSSVDGPLQPFTVLQLGDRLELSSMVIVWLAVPETLYSVEEETPSDQRESPTRVVGIGQRVAPPCTGRYVRRGMWDEDLGARRAVCFNETL